MMFEPMYMISQYLHALAVLVLFVKVWWNQDCTGISIKSQFLYTLVLTIRYLDLFTTFKSIQFTVLGAALIIFTYGSTLPMMLFFLKTYEKKYDEVGILTMIISCAAISFWVNRGFAVLEILWAFSLYLETLALVPQFQFCVKAKGIHWHMILFIALVGSSKVLCVLYWNYMYEYNDRSEEFFFYTKLREYYYERRNLELLIAPGVVQIILYCDFVIRIVPRLSIRRDAGQRTTLIATVENDVESGITGTGHFASNVVRAVTFDSKVLERVDNREKLLTAGNPYFFEDRLRVQSEARFV